MELIQRLKIKYYQGDNTMNVNATELKRLNYLLGQGYFEEIKPSPQFNDGTYDVLFVPNQKTQELFK